MHIPEYAHAWYLSKLLPTHELRRTLRLAAETLQHYDFDAIAFRGMSGALIAPALALQLNKSLIMVRKTTDHCHSFHLVEGDAAARTYIIADDFVWSGDTVLTIRHQLTRFAPRALCLGVLEASRLADAGPNHLDTTWL